jgi:hypothetical protein
MKISSETRDNVAALVWKMSADIRSPPVLEWERSELPVRGRGQALRNMTAIYVSTHTAVDRYIWFFTELGP